MNYFEELTESLGMKYPWAGVILLFASIIGFGAIIYRVVWILGII